MPDNACESEEIKVKKVLFVCLGNICRSPAAEGVFQFLVNKSKLQDFFQVDSAGTSGHHIGEAPDPRMVHAASKRGYQLNSRGRMFQPKSDFSKFDVIVAMDNSNLTQILKGAQTETDHSKVSLMTEWCKVHVESEVPDPYYGKEHDFEHVLNILEDACGELLNHLRQQVVSPPQVRVAQQ
jgi:protein-tyrosine phosphatase